METIGNRLRVAREDRELSIEDAAHRTRIQAIYIRGLENDDFSNFPSTTYAKSFLTLYSRFLEVDAEDALQQFAGGDAISLSGQGYLESVTDNIEPKRPSSAYANGPSRSLSARRPRAAASSPGVAPLFLGVILLALVIAIPTFWILGKDSDSMEDVVSKAEDLTTATFSPSEPKAEKVEPESAGEKSDETPKAGPPAPPAKPAPAPVKAQQNVPKETRVAQVIPPNVGERNLETSPGVTSSVITGQKPPASPRTPVRARPANPPPAGSQPDAPVTTSRPAESANQGQPLRAVPLIARPIIESDAGDESESSEESESAGPEENSASPDDGNRYPRPVE